MDDWDLTTIGLIVIVSSITIAGTIIGAILLGFSVSGASYLIIITLALIVMGAVAIFYENTKISFKK
jgi:hypothetical protein